MASDKDSQLEVLSHHYSETFELLKTDVAKRDRLFLYILIVIFLLLLYMSAPGVMGDLLNNFIRSELRDQSDANLIDVSFMGTILLLGLLSLSHTYFQTVLHVERQYKYVYQLEAELSSRFESKAFSREGEFYKSQRRIFSLWTKAIFWWLFPSLFLLFIVAWLIFLWGSSEATFAYRIVGTLISVSILTSLGLYMLALLKKK